MQIPFLLFTIIINKREEKDIIHSQVRAKHVHQLVQQQKDKNIQKLQW